MRTVKWNEGTWINPPISVEYRENGMLVEAANESDFWRNTAYGFVHDSAHAMIIDFPNGSAIEVSFILDFTELYDQAGLVVFADDEHWTKAGIEFADGAPQIGAVVTNVNSDWSAAPINQWIGKEVTFRASRSGNAVTIRAKCASEKDDWRLVRLLPIDPVLDWKAGPHCAAPSRVGLKVHFTKFEFGQADSSLH